MQSMPKSPPSRSFWNVAAVLAASQFQNAPDERSSINARRAVRVMRVRKLVLKELMLLTVQKVVSDDMASMTISSRSTRISGNRRPICGKSRRLPFSGSRPIRLFETGGFGGGRSDQRSSCHGGMPEAACADSVLQQRSDSLEELFISKQQQLKRVGC